MKDDALHLVCRRLEDRGQVPGDRLALTVFVSREVDQVGFRGQLLEFGYPRLALGRDYVLGFKVVFEVNPELALGQIADMAKRGLDAKVLA